MQSALKMTAAVLLVTGSVTCCGWWVLVSPLPLAIIYLVAWARAPRGWCVAVLLAGLSACGGAYPLNPTHCGLYLGADADWLTPTDLQEAEDHMLTAAAKVKDPRLSDRATACRSLQGVLVTPRAEGVWTDNGHRVRGISRCDYWGNNCTIEVGLSTSWRDSALVHELMHAAQHNTALAEPYVDGDAAHRNWIADGVFGAINVANAPVTVVVEHHREDRVP